MTKPAESSPCSNCPWRVSNQGRPHPHGWYTKKNLRRLWTGLKTGKADGMSCHPTDPNNEVPEGHLCPKVDNEPTECAGALLLVQRQIKLLEAMGVDAYMKSKHKGKLTKAGLQVWLVSRCQFGGMPFFGGAKMTAIDEDPDIAWEGIEEVVIL